MLKECVPNEVRESFLSGGQSNELATQHLNEMNKSFKDLPWNLSFSYGRLYKQPSLSSWKGEDKKVSDSQSELFKRSKLNSSATLGKYTEDLEQIKI